MNTLRISLDNDSMFDSLRAIVRHPWLAAKIGVVPTTVRFDHREVKATLDWQDLYEEGRTLEVSWRTLDSLNQPYVDVSPDLIHLVLYDIEVNTDSFLRGLEALDFEVGCVAMIHDWFLPDETPGDYRPPGFRFGHYGLGPFCFFRGKGHDRLVSQRWLEFGPWRVLKGSCDTTFVQFHDLAADADTAAEQAKPGHRTMIDGYIPPILHVASELRFFYHADVRQMRVVCAQGREVTAQEMRDARIIQFHNSVSSDRFAVSRATSSRLHSKFGTAKENTHRFPETEPFDSVAFVFTSDRDAEKHLHALWLHGLQCWSMERGQLRRLDDSYAATPPPKPSWVAQYSAPHDDRDQGR